MKARVWAAGVVAACVGLGVARPTLAQMAVVDVEAIGQLVAQIRLLQDQLAQAELHYEAIMGNRGMEQLLGDTVRNYLPRNWDELLAAIEGAGDFGELSAQIAAIRDQNAVLDEALLETLAEPERRETAAGRDSAASLQAISREALATTSERFEALQALIGAIANAEDPKAIWDLQARIQAEGAMLLNESNKLQLLYQTLQAQEWARAQREREQAIAGIGRLRDLPPIGLGE